MGFTKEEKLFIEELKEELILNGLYWSHGSNKNFFKLIAPNSKYHSNFINTISEDNKKTVINEIEENFYIQFLQTGEEFQRNITNFAKNQTRNLTVDYLKAQIKELSFRDEESLLLENLSSLTESEIIEWIGSGLSEPHSKRFWIEAILLWTKEKYFTIVYSDIFQIILQEDTKTSNDLLPEIDLIKEKNSVANKTTFSLLTLFEAYILYQQNNRSLALSLLQNMEWQKKGSTVIVSAGRENQLLIYIKQLCIDQKIIDDNKRNNKPFIQLIAPHTVYSDNFRKSLGKWLASDGSYKGIQDNDFLEDIAYTLGFDIKLWRDSESEQTQEIIRQCVEEFRVKNDIKKIWQDANIGALFKDNEKYQKDYTSILDQFRACQTPQDIKKLIPQQHIQKMLRNIPETQKFLIEVTQILYQKGAYFLLDKEVFPKYRTETTKNEQIKYIQAHVYGSDEVKNYNKAIDILENIDAGIHSKYLDYYTSLISNFLRRELENPSLVDLKETLIKAIKEYKKIFNKKNHYYPAINLAYTLSLTKQLYPEVTQFRFDNISNIFDKSKASIKKDKKSSQSYYYAYISEIEFTLLLDSYRDGSMEQCILKSKPSRDMCIRTLRQFYLYRDSLERYDVEVSDDFRGVISYMKSIC